MVEVIHKLTWSKLFVIWSTSVLKSVNLGEVLPRRWTRGAAEALDVSRRRWSFDHLATRVNIVANWGNRDFIPEE